MCRDGILEKILAKGIGLISSKFSVTAWVENMFNEQCRKFFLDNQQHMQNESWCCEDDLKLCRVHGVDQEEVIL